MTTWYVQRMNRPLGTIEAPDAHAAQSMATTMFGPGAYVFPPSHTGWAERLLGRWVQASADQSE